MSRGNKVSSENITDASTQSVQHWYFISAVEVLRETSARGFVIVGDSITDGRGSDTDENDRYVPAFQLWIFFFGEICGMEMRQKKYSRTLADK